MSWTAPYNGGSQITSYTVVLMTSNGFTYSETVDCDGTDPTVVSTQTCSISVYTFRGNPFNLQWGSSIYAKVSATNIVGTGALSMPGNGALIYTKPDPPQALANNLGTSTMTSIGLTWYQGISDGGSPVLDYRIFMKESAGEYSVLVDGLQ